MGRTSKIDNKIKIKACEDHLIYNRSFTSIANQIGVNRSTVRNWVLAYSTHGPEGFDTRNKTYRHSEELRTTILNQYLSGESSAAAIAGKYNISGATVLRWI